MADAGDSRCYGLRAGVRYLVVAPALGVVVAWIVQVFIDAMLVVSVAMTFVVGGSTFDAGVTYLLEQTRTNSIDPGTWFAFYVLAQSAIDTFVGGWVVARVASGRERTAIAIFAIALLASMYGSPTKEYTVSIAWLVAFIGLHIVVPFMAGHIVANRNRSHAS